MRALLGGIVFALAFATTSARADELARTITASGLAHNPSQGFSLSFDTAGVRVTPRLGAPLVLRTAHIQRGTNQRFVPRGHQVLRGTRASLSRGWIEEWHENLADGLEHGWTLASNPLPGVGPLEIHVDIAGGRAPVLVTSNDVIFVDPGGVGPIHYSRPTAVDSVGRGLPVALDVGHGQVVVRVRDEGAVYPIYVDPLVWGEINALTAPSTVSTREFGFAVDLDETGERLAVGARSSSTLPGHAFVFVRRGAAWALETDLVSPESAPGDTFGESVALEGDTLLVGAPAGTTGGAVFVHRRAGAAWSHVETLRAPPPADGDAGLGRAIELDGDLMAVESCALDRTDPGQLFFFRRSGGRWIPDGQISPGDPARRTCVAATQNLALASGRAAYGASYQSFEGSSPMDSGAVFIIEQRGGTWTETAVLRPPMPTPAQYGDAVALIGQHLVVGARSDVGINLPDRRGFAFVYELQGDGWVETQVLRAPPTSDYDHFGHDVFAWEDRVAVGAHHYLWPDGTTVGAVFVYRFDTTGTLGLETELSPPMGMRWLGRSLAAVGDMVVSGCPVTDPPSAGGW